jgi:hypothetical protein
MVAERGCESCSGCTGRHTDKQVDEETNAAPYLAFAAIMVVLVSVAAKWLFF